MYTLFMVNNTKAAKNTNKNTPSVNPNQIIPDNAFQLESLDSITIYAISSYFKYTQLNNKLYNLYRARERQEQE